MKHPSRYSDFHFFIFIIFIGVIKMEDKDKVILAVGAGVVATVIYLRYKNIQDRKEQEAKRSPTLTKPTLVVVVKDSNGVPISNAHLEFEKMIVTEADEATGGYKFNRDTDVNGMYREEFVTGTFSVKVTAEGYQSVSGIEWTLDKPIVYSKDVTMVFVGV